MKDTIETKGHIAYWINEITAELNRERIELTDKVLYSGDEIDDNLVNDMLEQTVKLKSYLEKLRDNKYE